MDREGSGEDSPESSPHRRRGKGGAGGRNGGGAVTATGKGSSTATSDGHGGRRTPTYTGDFTQQSPNIHTRQAVILWLQETYGVVPNSGLSTPKEDVYKDYTQLCARDGKSAMARATFGKILHVAFPGITCNRLGRRGSTKHSYRWLHRHIPLSDDDDSNSPDGQRHARQTDSPDYPSSGHHSGNTIPAAGGGSALDSYPGYSLGSSIGLSRPGLSSHSPGSSSSLSPSFTSPSTAGGGSAATLGPSASPPPSPIHLSTSLPPLPVYHPPFSPSPSAMHSGYPGSFVPSPSASAYLMAASPSAVTFSSVPHRRVPSPPPHPYPYQQHLGSSYLSPSMTPQEPARAPGPRGWSSHLDSLLYDTSGGSGVTGALNHGSAEELPYRQHSCLQQLPQHLNNDHHQLQQPHHPSLPIISTPSHAGNLPRHHLAPTPSLGAGPTSSPGPSLWSSLYPPLRPSPDSQPPFPPPRHGHSTTPDHN